MKLSGLYFRGKKSEAQSSELSRADPGFALDFPANAGIVFFDLAGLPMSQHAQCLMPCVFLMIKTGISKQT